MSSPDDCGVIAFSLIFYPKYHYKLVELSVILTNVLFPLAFSIFAKLKLGLTKAFSLTQDNL